MRFCFPITTEKGLDSRLAPHFGSAPSFMLVESKGLETESVALPDRRPDGGCWPIQMLAGHGFDAMVVGRIGPGALNKLLHRGARVYLAQGRTVRENLDLYEQGALVEYAPQDACQEGGGGHGGGSGCHQHGQGS